MTVLYYLFLIFFILLSAFLCFIVLIQESKSLGLGASFGGDAGSSVFGTSTAEVLKKVTSYLGIAFMVSCVFLSIWTSALGKQQERHEQVIIENTTE